MTKTKSADHTVTVHVQLTFNRRRGYTITLPDAAPAHQPRTDNALLKALARAHRWRRRIETGKYNSISELARSHGVNDSYACRLLRLTLLAPSTIARILDGQHEASLTLKELSKPFSNIWSEQEAALRYTD